MWRWTTLALIATVAAGGCGGGSQQVTDPDDDLINGIAPPAGGVAAFSVSPVDLDQIAILTPLGSLNPPGHVLPTDHVYFYQVDFDHRPAVPPTASLPVFAPTTGAVNFILSQGTSGSKIQFVVTREFSYYLDHVVLRPGLTLGTVVQAGEQVGTTTPGGTLDLGAIDSRVTLPGLLVPERYPWPTRHAVSPWKYFTEPLRSTIYARLRRSPGAADKDGRIDFGISGRLAGDWFHESIAAGDEPGGPATWPKTIAFVADYYDPDQVRISIGGMIDNPGVWGIPPGAPRPEDVSVQSGRIVYRLMYLQSTNAQRGLMVVQMLSDTRIRVQIFPGADLQTADFDANARIYLR